VQNQIPLETRGDGPESHARSTQQTWTSESSTRRKRQSLETVTWKNLKPVGTGDRKANATFQESFSVESRSQRHSHLFEPSQEQYPHHLMSNGGSRNDSTDHLMTAILDGDIQGIRSIVRSRGDSLHSEYWREICASILPLHRAIAGLHFHGNGTILVHTIETLIQLGANVNVQDSAGNTPLHKVGPSCLPSALCSPSDLRCDLRPFRSAPQRMLSKWLRSS
jgi:hypothetical protein